MSGAELLFFGELDLDEIAERAAPHGTIAWFATQNPYRERPSQDRGLIWTRGDQLVLAIADGAGGLPSGDVAAQTALACLARTLEQGAEQGLRAALVDGFENAEHEVTSLGLGAATTLVAVAIEQDSFRVLHAGDSACLVVGQRGVLRHETIAHSPVGYGVESGLIDATDAMVHEDRHLVSNLLGFGELRIEIGPKMDLRPFDTVVLASDGLFDNLHVDEIIDVVRKGPLFRAAATLRGRCATQMTGGDAAPGKPDDLSYILYRPRRK